MRKLLVATVAVGAMVGTSAMADDTWTGFYFGGHVGFGFGQGPAAEGFGYRTGEETIENLPDSVDNPAGDAMDYLDDVGFQGRVSSAPDAALVNPAGHFGLTNCGIWCWRGLSQDVDYQEETSENLDGILAGFQAGYLFQSNSGLVVGVEAAFSFSTLQADGIGIETIDRWVLTNYQSYPWNNGDVGGYLTQPEPTQYYGYQYSWGQNGWDPNGWTLDHDIITTVTTLNVAVGNLSTLRGRVGFAAGRFLPYITGGLASAPVTVTTAASITGYRTVWNSGNWQNNTGAQSLLQDWADLVNGGSPNPANIDQQGPFPPPAEFPEIPETVSTVRHTGYTIGAGLEIAINDNWSVRGEYTYTNLGAQSHAIAGGGTIDVNPRIHAVTFGVNFRFGGL